MAWRVGNRSGVLALLLLVSAAHASDSHFLIPADLFTDAARGPCQTGTFEELWVDDSREESTTTDPTDKRRLLVQVWYPATFDRDAERAPYVLQRDLYPDDEAHAWLDRVKDIRTASVLNADPDPRAAPYPILIYNPGMGYPAFTGTFIAEFLASHGYLVVAVGHTEITHIRRFPDGSRYEPDAYDAFAEGPNLRGLPVADVVRARVKEWSQTLMPTHIKDIGFVLDRLGTQHRTRGSRFHGLLNPDVAGALGWSMGGALSLQAARDEPRIKAAVNLDGALYTTVQETGAPRPILHIHEPLSPWEAAPELREVFAFLNDQLWQLYGRTERRSSVWYDVTLPRTAHNHFSDLSRFEAADPKHLDPKIAHEIINRLTLEFFDEYLKERPGASVRKRTQDYPEALLLTNAPDP